MASDLPRDDKVSDPGRRMWLITPHNTEPLGWLTKALRFDNAGTVKFKPVDSDDDVTLNVVAGERIDVRATHVRATGTTNGLIIHGQA